MTAFVRVTARYRGDADAIFARALRYDEMAEAMAGMGRFTGLPDGVAQERQRFTVSVVLYGLIKNEGHEIFIERVDPAARILQSRERGPGIRRWDHEISIQPNDAVAGEVVWTDSVHVDAGWRTPFVARFAAFMYSSRHRRRKALSIERSVSAAAAA